MPFVWNPVVGFIHHDALRVSHSHYEGPARCGRRSWHNIGTFASQYGVKKALVGHWYAGPTWQPSHFLFSCLCRVLMNYL